MMVGRAGAEFAFSSRLLLTVLRWKMETGRYGDIRKLAGGRGQKPPRFEPVKFSVNAGVLPEASIEMVSSLSPCCTRTV